VKDFYISGEVIRKEFFVFFWCFLIAIGINLVAILYYRTNWIELLTSIDVTLVIAMCIYLIVGLIRLTGKAFSRLYH